MKNKKMLKVLSTSFILGTILMTSPSFADKAEGVSLNEKLADNKDLTNSVTSEAKETKVVSDESEATEEKDKELELTNDDNSKENSEKLEWSSDVEKEAVRAKNGEIEYKNYETEVKYDSNMAYGDFRVDQEGVLGQYKDGKELVKPVNKIITVGTNKNLVEKIKYNEKYSIEDPGTFNYTEHALRNIKAINKGLQRTIYSLREHNLPNYGNDKYNEDRTWNIQVNIEDGADISKDLEDLYKIGINNDDLSYLQGTNQYDYMNIENYSKLKTNYDYKSEIQGYINLWIMNKKGLLHDKTYVLNDSNKFINDFIREYKNNDSGKSCGYLRFYVNNNYKVPFVETHNKANGSMVYLSRELFDKIYPEIVRELRAFNGNSRITKIDTISVNPIFAEDPASLKFNYSGVNGSDYRRYFEITTQELTDFDYNLYPNIKGIKEEDMEANSYVAKKLNPDKVYSMQINIDNYSSDYQKDVDPLIKKYGSGDIYQKDDGFTNYFYYNIKNIPYFSDSTLKFKEKKLIKGDGKKNVVLPYFGDKEGYIDFYKYYLTQVKSDPQVTPEDKKEIKALIDKMQNTKDLTEFSEFVSENRNLLYSVIANKEYLNFLNNNSWGDKISNYAIGNVDTKTEEFGYKTIKKDDPTLEKGQTKVVTKGVNGKKITKITYKVDRTSGELTDPVSEVVEDTKPVDEIVLVGTKNVIPATPIEDIAKTTKTTKEVIKAKVEYEADDTLEFEKQNVVTKPVDGEKEITTVSQSDKKDVVTKKVTKDKVDGVTKVGNKKVEVETKDGITTTTTTIYEVEKETGKLVNPKVTTHKTTKAGIIEDIAKKTIPATKIEDIAKKTIPATKIEDIAKKSNKDSEKEAVHEPKRTSHLPKAGVNSEILTLAVGALATISGINLSKKRRR